MSDQNVSYVNLRRRGWRLHSTDCSGVPHMVYRLSSRLDTALEIGPTRDNETEWSIWLRSDLAHSRCRFCYMRTVTTMNQVGRLILAIMDGELPPVEGFDEAQFNVSLQQEREDASRRFSEYVRNERWSYVPG